MKLNINKDMLLKNRFWILLGVSVCLILTGIFYLQFAVDADDAVNILRGAYTKSANLKAGFKGPDAIEQAKAIAARAKKLESEVWKDAYEAQKDWFTWPARFEEEFQFRTGNFATAITVNKPTDQKDWPPDSDSLVHGHLLEHHKDWIRIKLRKGETKLYRTESVKMVNLAEKNVKITFFEMKDHVGKLVIAGFQKGRYFNEPLTDSQKQLFADSYQSQIDDILRSVDPLDDKGNGVVQMRNWLYRKGALPVVDEKADPAAMVGYPFFRFVTKEWETKSDTSTEAWIAQENLWIQKEIYRIIAEANQNVSNFVRVGGDNKAKENVYRNTNFELTLSLQKEDLKFTIKNLQPRKQRLDLSFRILMDNGVEPEIVRISGPPLPAVDQPGNLYTQVIPKEKIQRKGIFKVQQVLSWETAAIRRIDQISIGSVDGADGSHSHRTFPDGLVSLEPAAASEIKAPIGFPPIGGIPPRKGAGVGGGPGANGGVLKHDLWTERYIEVSEQSRRVPVAIVLIVDQSYVSRILTGFNNSKLRFLDTQVLLNHYSGSLQPPASPDKVDGGGAGVGFPLFPGGRPPIGPMGPQGMPPAQASGGGDLEANMELVLYGIMTLYERYPPRPPAEKKL